MTKVHIVVPTINLWEKCTRACLDSINTAMMRAKTHDIECTLQLIDNASTDETQVEATKRTVHPNFIYTRNGERWGFQRSVNFGVKTGITAVDAEYFLICNNDILLHSEAIWRLIERFKKGDENIGMVTCMDVRGQCERPESVFDLNTKDFEAVAEAPHPNFSAFMVDKLTWEFCGEFDELFAPAYFEDNDFHYRMKLANAEAIVYPPALFYHYGSKTQNEANENGRPLVPGPMFENNRAAFVRKWGGVPGHETYTHPCNDETRSIRSTTQNNAA
jgi:GT2 family glycosyltransferase